MEQSVLVLCPTCGEETAVWIDLDDGSAAIESDCQVCCRPLHVHVTVHCGEIVDVAVAGGW